MTGFQKYVLCLYCSKWGAPFPSRLPHEHAPWRTHSQEPVYIFTPLPSVGVGLLSVQWFPPSELSSLGGRAFASTIFLRFTTTYPACRLPWSMQLLPLVNSSISGSAEGWSVKSGLLEYTSSMKCRQSCSGDCAPSIGSNVAGFRAEVTWSLTLELSKRMAWYFPVLPELSQ